MLESDNRHGCTPIHYAAINSGDVLNELLNNANGILLLDEIINSPIYLDGSKFTFRNIIEGNHVKYCMFCGQPIDREYYNY